MQRKYSSFICCILAFLMTFTGMCMNTKQASSFFECSTLENQASQLFLPDDDTITSEVLCTQSMLGISESASIRQLLEHKTIWTKWKNIFVQAIKYEHSERTLNLHITIEKIYVSNACLKAIILNYIHKKDGKK